MVELLVKTFGPNWRTTLLGIGSILGALADVAISLANGTPPHYQADMAAVWTGLVGIFAKDAGVTNAGNPVPAREIKFDK
jgi:hypothetical protein